jgi:hypothetical protein
VTEKRDEALPGGKVLIVSAADARYFDLLEQLIASCRAGPIGSACAIAILDVGLSPEQRTSLAAAGITCVEPRWETEWPWRDRMPPHYRSLWARPYLPRYFPGFDTYLWIDADAWVQDDTILRYFLRAAGRGKLAIVQELDRGYWTLYKPPKLWGQNQKAFAWGYGWHAGYRYGRYPILNGGVWALAGDAPHWAAWQSALDRALAPYIRRDPPFASMYFQMIEQTAQNYVVFADRLPATFLPAYCNWFCGKGDPMYDPERGLLVEPHEPHRPLGIVHLAGKGVKDRVFTLATPQGGRVETQLGRGAIEKLAGAIPDAARRRTAHGA